MGPSHQCVLKAAPRILMYSQSREPLRLRLTLPPVTEDSSMNDSNSWMNWPKTKGKKALGKKARRGSCDRTVLRAGTMSPSPLTLQCLSQCLAHSRESIIFDAWMKITSPPWASVRRQSGIYKPTENAYKQCVHISHPIYKAGFIFIEWSDMGFVHFSHQVFSGQAITKQSGRKWRCLVLCNYSTQIPLLGPGKLSLWVTF